MLEKTIIKTAQKLIKDYGTRNPFELCSATGIKLMWRDDFDRLKGMYTVILDERFVILNRNMEDNIAKIVCAHELGHDLFHRSLAADSALQEFMIYDMASRPEYEANIFAAELLLPDDDVLECVRLDYDAVQTASALSTDINLVALKLSAMARRGYDLRPMDAKSDFLGD